MKFRLKVQLFSVAIVSHLAKLPLLFLPWCSVLPDSSTALSLNCTPILCTLVLQHRCFAFCLYELHLTHFHWSVATKVHIITNLPHCTNSTMHCECSAEWITVWGALVELKAKMVAAALSFIHPVNDLLMPNSQSSESKPNSQPK